LDSTVCEGLEIMLKRVNREIAAVEARLQRMALRLGAGG